MAYNNRPMMPGQGAYSMEQIGYPGYNIPGAGTGWGASPTPNPTPMSTQTVQAPFVGRFITSLKDVRPNEIPTDGRPALFPNEDLGEIYLKSWGSDGLIRTFRYVLDTTTDLNAPQAQQTDGGNYQQLESRLDQLEELIRKNSKSRSGSTPKNEEAK